jgi:pyruvate dehydrogenase E2 component (dihydrolipoamide acetyltransferase)
MSVEIVMPQLGLTMTEGSVGAWLKQPGDSVRKDEIILSVTTDKVDMDVEAPADGTMGNILVDVGKAVPVGTVLVHILAAGESAATPEATTEASAQQPASVHASPPPVRDSIPVLRDRIIASPRARKVAAANGVNLAVVHGSGPHGRIVAADVEAAVQTQAAAPREIAVDGYTRRRQLIADRMVESISTIPAFSVSVEVDARQLVMLYQDLKERVLQIAGAKLTYTDLLLKALAVALARTSEMNVLWQDGAVRQLSDITIGMAVATERGVVAPVIRRAGGLSLDQLVGRRLEMTEKARNSKLAFADLEGASGTLSNLGMYRVDRFEGIITPGQTFILAVGQLRKRPFVVEDAVVAAPTLLLNLSVDHRAADGALAARFLGEIAEAIERPYQLLWSGPSISSEVGR